MDQTVLVNEEVEAGELLVEQFDKVMPVAAAFWIKPDELDRWYLYLASEQVDGSTIRRGYSEVHRIAKSLQSHYLDPFQVKLIHTEHPLAQAVFALRKRHPAPIALRLRGQVLGDMAIESAYIYPQVASVP